MKLIYVLVFLLCCLFCTEVQSQILTTKGKEFYLTYFYSEPGGDTAKTYLYVTAPYNTIGNVTNPNTGFNIPFSIAAGIVTTVEIPKAQASNFIDGSPQNLGVIVTAVDTITAFALNNKRHSSDATDLIQKDALGTKYLIACYDGLKVWPGLFYYSVFAVMATEDNTSVSITPSVTTNAGEPAGVPFNITLNKGQVYYVRALANLTGSWVSVNNDCKKIAVFSGAEVNYAPSHILPGTGSGDQFYEQLFPVNAFGKEFITTKLKGRNVYVARVYAAYDNTIINIDGVNAATINAGKFYEYESLNQPRYVKTSNPSEVMMFACSVEYDTLQGSSNVGDPTMFTIPPLEQALTESIFISPQTTGLTIHKVNVLCKTANAYSTVLDGVNIGDSFHIVTGNPVYSYAAMETTAGQHRITNPNGFIAYAYGFGDHQGYGYCTGSGVKRIDAYFTCNGVASISSPTIDVCTGPAVFDIVTSKTNAGYRWDFGDGSPFVSTDGTVLQQTHTYAAAGNYIVKMITTSSTGNACELSVLDTTQLTLHVVTSLVPSVSLVASPQGPVCTGTAVSVVASVTNAGQNPVYEWTVNGIVVGTNTLSYTSGAFKNSDVVSCKVTSSLTCAAAANSTASIGMQVNSSIAPTIVISTDSVNICGSVVVTFKAVIGTGISLPVYQWKVNGVNSGTNNPAFTYNPLNKDTITCALTVAGGCYNPNTVTSNAIGMAVQAAVNSPSLTISVPQTIICAGTNSTFTAAAVNGGSTPVYQWKINGINSGNNSAVFTSTTIKNNDIISCVLTSSEGCLTSPTASSNSISMQVNPTITPGISIAANATTICEGSTTTITATPANGGTTPAYQWKINGINAGANDPAFTYSNFKNNDIVTCSMVSNAACSVNPVVSNPVVITVSSLIHTSVSVQASPNRICQGEKVVFTATVTSGANAVYKWYVNGILSNASSSDFSTVLLSNQDRVKCEVISALACADTAVSNEIIMQVDALPTVNFNPAELILLTGNSVTLNPVVTGDIATYLWSPSDNLNNTNAASVIANPVENKTYQLKVTTTANCEATGVVTVKVFRDLLMPNAFTPNGNGTNDLFRIPPGFTVSIHYFTIYNRWGQKVFETKDAAKGWDGKANGVLAEAGAFNWMIEYINPFKKEVVFKKGMVLLVR